MSAVFPAEAHVKGVGEVRTVPFNYSNFPEILGGDTLSSATVTGNPGGLTVGSASVSAAVVDGIPIGQAILAVVSGGTDGVDYALTCLATTAAGSVLEVRGVLSVSDER